MKPALTAERHAIRAGNGGLCVLIPAILRRSWNLRPGDILEISIDQDSFRVTPKAQMELELEEKQIVDAN